jgi:hypothetical protein
VVSGSFFRNVEKMQQLNFPPFEFKLRNLNNRQEIFDPVRHKFVTLTPEEWVRQHLISYLSQIKGYPISIIGVEKQMMLNKMPKRFDLVIFKRNGAPLLLAECKAPGVEITEKAFDQAARYNMLLQAEYFLITNGLEHYPCRIDYENKQYIFIEDVPNFSDLSFLKSG